LLRLNQAGDSAESLVGGLRLLGIHIGRETMRRWLQRELGQKPTRRKRSRRLPVGFAPTMKVPFDEKTARRAAENIIPPSSTRSAVAADASPPTELEQAAPERRSSLTLPGETPYEALRRRLAVLDAQKAAAKNTGAATVSGQATMISTPPA
jgi:hypothetical protein